MTNVIISILLFYHRVFLSFKLTFFKKPKKYCIFLLFIFYILFSSSHYNKPLDLTLPVRFANLSNNAQLELQPVKVARKPCLVTVGLQLESGERIMKDFVPSTSVWDVVEQCLNTR